MIQSELLGSLLFKTDHSGRDIRNILTASGELKEYHKNGVLRRLKSHGLSATVYTGENDPELPSSITELDILLSRIDPDGNKRLLLSELNKNGFVGIHFLPIKEMFSTNIFKIATEAKKGISDLVLCLTSNKFDPSTIIFGATGEKMSKFAIKSGGFLELARNPDSEKDKVFIYTRLGNLSEFLKRNQFSSQK